MFSLNSWCNSYQARIYNQYVDTFQRIESYSYALHNYCKYNKWVLKVKKFTGTSYNPAALIRNTNKPKYHTHNTMTTFEFRHPKVTLQKAHSQLSFRTTLFSLITDNACNSHHTFRMKKKCRTLTVTFYLFQKCKKII